MYSYWKNKTIRSTLDVTLGNVVSKVFIVVMILATFVLPSSTRAQWDVDVEDPAPWIGTQQSLWSNTVADSQPDILLAPELDDLWWWVHHGIAVGKLSYKIDPTTLMSYAKWGGRWSILCSTIARINLSTLTGLPYSSAGFSEWSIARGDAYALALRGASKWQMIVTNKSSFESDIWNQYYQTRNTIFDVYFYKGSNGGVMQWHRAVVFIGIDDNIYILDPIRGQITAKPQLLSSHFAADSYRGYTMYISKFGYKPRVSYHTIDEYYEVRDDLALTQLVDKNLAYVQDNPLSSDVTLVIQQPMKVVTDVEHIVLEKWTRLTIQRTPTLVWWRLVEDAGKLKAHFVEAEVAAIADTWDKLQ